MYTLYSNTDGTGVRDTTDHTDPYCCCWTCITENMHSASATLKSNNSVSTAVCRNLFGPVDHERLKMDYKAAISESVEEAKRRWNFDFVNEVPLQGEFKWEKVHCPDTSGCKRKQKLITEFFQVKRRCSSFSKPV